MYENPVVQMLIQARESAQGDPDAWRRSAQVNLLNKVITALSQPAPSSGSDADLLELEGVQRQFNQALRTIQSEHAMRQRVFKPGDRRRHDKLAEMDQVTDTLVYLARRVGLRTPADRPAVAQQGALFGGG